MKQIYIVVFIFSALCTRLGAQDVIDKTVDAIQNVELYFKENKTCPDYYKLIYIKCGNDLKPNCIRPEDQTNCNSCWEVHWGPCAGKPSGGMWFYDSFERANRAAYLSSSTSYCPWFESSNYMIVVNDPKRCLNKPTGYEMVSWPSPLQIQSEYVPIDKFPALKNDESSNQKNKENTVENKKQNSSNEVDDLLAELLEDNNMSDDEKTNQQFEKLKKETKTILSEAEAESKTVPKFESNDVKIRGLAGKIESGEFDPSNPNKNNTNNNNIASNQNNNESTNSSSGQGTNNSSGSSSATNSGSSSSNSCKHNPGTGDLNLGSRNYSGGTCSLFSPNDGCSLKGVYLSSGSDYIKIYNMPTASSGSFSIKNFLNCNNCDLYISYPYGASYSGTLTKTGPNCFTFTCTMKDPQGKTSSMSASGTYK